MARRRKLAPEERALWEKVAARATPLHPEKAAKKHKPRPPKPGGAAEPSAQAAPLSPFRLGERVGDTAPITMPEPTPAPQPRLDRRLSNKLRRGKMVPEARIDLHGLTQAQALPALQGFILRASAEGLRLVLVITGKGQGADATGPIPEYRGILRRNVPHWLQSGPIAPLVHEVMPAHRQHGGEGALYVWLRRRR